MLKNLQFINSINLVGSIKLKNLTLQKENLLIIC